MDGPHCDGTGYTMDGDWEEFICPMCDGAGSFLVVEEAPGAGGQPRLIQDHSAAVSLVSFGGGTAADAVDDDDHLRYRRLDCGHAGQQPGPLVFAQRWGAAHGTRQEIGAAANGRQGGSQVVAKSIEGIEWALGAGLILCMHRGTSRRWPDGTRLSLCKVWTAVPPLTCPQPSPESSARARRDPAAWSG